MTNQDPWSKSIKRWRCSWFGHLARLPFEIPVRQALEECKRPVRKPKQKTAWYKMMKTELKEVAVDTDAEVAVDVDAAGVIGRLKHTQDRKLWKALICLAMSI